MKARIVVLVDGREVWRSGRVELVPDSFSEVHPSAMHFAEIYRALFLNSSLQIRVVTE